MSGKAPPRGPRALLGSKPPPTGPRSLTNGYTRQVNGLNEPSPPPEPEEEPPPPPPAPEPVGFEIAGPATRTPIAFAFTPRGASKLQNRQETRPPTPPPEPREPPPPPPPPTAQPPPEPRDSPPPPPPPRDPPPPTPPPPIHIPYTIHMKKPKLAVSPFAFEQNPPPPTSVPPALPPPIPPPDSPPPQPPPPPSSAPPPPPPPPASPPPPPPPEPNGIHASPKFISEPEPPPEPPREPTPPPPPPPRTPTPTPLPPPASAVPEWPPPRSAYPSARSFRVLFDSAVDAQPSAPRVDVPYFRRLISHIREHASPAVVAERIRGKVGKEVLVRVEGEVMPRVDDAAQDEEAGVEEAEPVVADPRRAPDFVRPASQRPLRTEFTVPSYEHDANTPFAPPTTVLLTGIPPLTPNTLLQRHLAVYGPVAHLARQMDRITGATLGVAAIRFATADAARRCVEAEDGRRGAIAGWGAAGVGEEERRAVMDTEGRVLKALLAEMEERTKREREERRRREKEEKEREKEVEREKEREKVGEGGKEREKERDRDRDRVGRENGVGSGSGLGKGKGKADALPPASLPLPPPPPAAVQTLKNPVHPSLPPNPFLAAGMSSSGSSPAPPNQHEPRVRRGRPVPVSGANAIGAVAMSAAGPWRGGSGGGRSGWALPRRPVNSYRPARSRSPSPNSTEGVMQRRLAEEREAKERARDAAGGARGKGREKAADMPSRERVRAELLLNGRDYLRLRFEGTALGEIKDAEVWKFCEQFSAEKVLRDDLGIYVTFRDVGTARRAERVLHGRMLGNHVVTLLVQPPPLPEATARVRWEDADLVARASELICKELKDYLEKDISDRLVATQLRRIASETHHRVQAGDGEQAAPSAPARRDLKTLSFKKQKKDVEVLVEEHGEEEEKEEEQVVVERPKKKRKKEATKRQQRRIVEEEIEVESEDDDDDQHADEVWAGRKRLASEEREEEEPSRKKLKVEPPDAVVNVKKGSKKKKVADKHKSSVDEVILPDEYEAPAVADLHVSSGLDSSLSPSRSPSPLSDSQLPPRVPTPLPNALDEGICEDDEDLYYAKLVLSGRELEPTLDPLSLPPSAEAQPYFRKHVTGSARTEGYYKITHAEKIAYVTQYQARATNVEVAAPADEAPLQHVESSRSNRANARRRAQGLEEINQVQRAVALSKGESTANELTFKFNQLQTRKKHLRFARSPIHDWGLYAMEKISRGEMVIEYVGEIIRAQVAEKREKAYERQGIGSSYLFRIDEDLVVDATKKGNLGRLINHSCDPNCTAKIITINGEKKIVIYAKQEIELGDEITYDYHFPFEQDKIPCLCGSVKCRGFLN